MAVLQINDGNPGSGRIANLDWLRGIAILGVVLHHYCNGSGNFLKPVRMVAWYGYTGVICFFVITGLVIGQSMFARHYSVRTDFVPFMLKRLLKLYPPLLITLLLCAAVQGSHVLWLDGHWSDWKTWLGSLLLTEGWGYVNPVLWFLAVEIQFYLFIGLFARVFLDRSWNWCFWAMTALLAGLHMFSETPVLLKGIPYLLAGSLIFRKRCGIGWKYEFPLLTVLLMVCVALRHSAVEVAVMAFSMGVVFLPPLKLSPLAWVGKISYSLMLVHGPVASMMIVVYSVLHWGGMWKIALIMAGIPISFLLSYLLWKYVEQPMTGISRRLPERMAKPPRS